MENRKFYRILLIGAIFVLIVVGILLFVNMTNRGINDSGGRSPLGANGTTGFRQGQEPPAVGQVNMTDLKAEAQGGDIQFYPDGGSYTGQVKIQLSFKPLKSLRGDVISSNIYYTIDGTEPTRDNGQQYPRNGSISLSTKGTFTIKARLISKVGKYEGDVYSQTYTIRFAPGQKPSNQTSISMQPETRETPPENNTITDFESLDENTKSEIRESMNRITIEVEGIDSIKKNDDLKLHLAISKEGAANVLDISGFEVEPVEKMAEIRTSLNQKIEGVTFSPPTVNENPVDVEVWVSFKKIAKFFEKIIFER